jgi:hypothetical protein
MNNICDEEKTMPSEWDKNANWIWSPEGSRGSWYIFVKDFMVNGDEIESAKLLITSCTYHEVYINDKCAGRGPVRSFEFDKCYDCIDALRYISAGENRIRIISPQLQPPYSHMPQLPDKGLLCQLTVVYKNGDTKAVCTDGSWKVHKHDAFVPDTSRFAVMLGPEEQYDARIEPLANGNISEWDDAWVLGPVGIPPWTGMRKNLMLPMTAQSECPKELIAAELTEKPEGYHFRLGPESYGLKVFMTQVTAKEDTSVLLRFTSSTLVVYVNGKPADVSKPVRFKQGKNVLSFCQMHFSNAEPELLMETSTQLAFASVLFEDIQWMLYLNESIKVAYPWHEVFGDLIETDPNARILLETGDINGMSESLRASLTPAIVKDASSLHYVMTQHYLLPDEGRAFSPIEERQPRKRIGKLGSAVIYNEKALFLKSGECAAVEPQKGRGTHLIFDFSTEVIGHIQIDIDAPEGTVLDVQGFELIDGRGIAWMNVHNGFRYICREGRQEFTSSYRRGFRYLSITVSDFKRPISVFGIRCIRTQYPVSDENNFVCSDGKLNDIYNMSINTAKVCMLDTYVDCPGHEQAVWVGDARITGRINMVNFGEYAFDQYYLRMIGQFMCKEWVDLYRPGDVRCLEGRYLPGGSFPNYPEGDLPMWAFQWALQVWEHYWYGGDIDDLRENYVYVKEMLRHCELMANDRGLLDIPGAWNLIEWGNNDLSPYGEVTANNAFLVLCLRRASQMAKALGNDTDAKKYEKEAVKQSAIINCYCWDEKRKAFVDTVRDEWAYGNYLKFAKEKGAEPMDFEAYMSCARISAQTNTIALLCGCVPDDRLKEVRKIVVDSVASGRYVAGSPSKRSVGAPSDTEAPNGIVAIGSPFFLFFSLETLYDIGYSELALKTIRRDWSDMLAGGTNTCWETFKHSEEHWTRSIAHAWSASPAVFLPAEVLGVRPEEAGYRKFSINPKPADLKWARGSVPTPFGPIHVQWEKGMHGKVNVQWRAPEQCEKV